MRQRDFRTFFESILGPSWAPKGGSNGAQVGPKTDQNRRRKRRCNKKVFKIVLGRSWSRLGAIFGPSWPKLKPSWNDFEASGGCKFVFSEVYHFVEESRFCIKMLILTALGAILGDPGSLGALPERSRSALRHARDGPRTLLGRPRDGLGRSRGTPGRLQDASESGRGEFFARP